MAGRSRRGGIEISPPSPLLKSFGQFTGLMIYLIRLSTSVLRRPKAMPYRRRTAIVLSAACALLFTAIPGSSQIPAPARPAASRIPRMPDGKPNFTGLWEALGTADWDIQDHSAHAGPLLSAWSHRRRTRGSGDCRRRRDSVYAGRQSDAKRKSEKPPEARSRGQVRHARNTARQLHAVSISDH